LRIVQRRQAVRQEILKFVPLDVSLPLFVHAKDCKSDGMTMHRLRVTTSRDAGFFDGRRWCLFDEPHSANSDTL
jgi:hypothetical protein